MKLAILGPGQGAQHVGMGADVAAVSKAARDVFDEASDVLGLDLLGLCREGPEEALVRTDVQQPAILAVGAAVYAALRERKLLPERSEAAAFGLSLGEFTALYVSGALSLADALRVVRERGLGMQEASERVPSGLLALRTTEEEAEALCAEVRGKTGGVLSVANLNAPGQVVISGDAPSLDAAEAAARDRGIRRPTRLPVAGAFHSELMAPGAERLRRALDAATVRTPRIPIVSNVTGEATTDPQVIRRNLIAQVTHPVRFVDCVRTARRLGVGTTVELAPGRILSGLVRRIEPDLATQSVESAVALEAFSVAAEPAGGAEA